MKYIFIILILSGCYTQNKATKQVNRALEQYPAMVAEKTREAFPCIVTSTDTRTDTVYELLEVECPELGKPIINNHTDTLWREKTTYLKSGRQVIYLPSETRTVTTFVEDSAKIFLATKEKDEAITKLADVQEKSNRRGKWNIYLLIALLISLGVNYILTRKR